MLAASNSNRNYGNSYKYISIGCFAIRDCRLTSFHHRITIRFLFKSIIRYCSSTYTHETCHTIEHLFLPYPAIVHLLYVSSKWLLLSFFVHFVKNSNNAHKLSQIIYSRKSLCSPFKKIFILWNRKKKLLFLI